MCQDRESSMYYIYLSALSIPFAVGVYGWDCSQSSSRVGWVHSDRTRKLVSILHDLWHAQSSNLSNTSVTIVSFLLGWRNLYLVRYDLSCKVQKKVEVSEDTIIFGLTLYRTLAIYYKHRKGCAIPLVKIMLRDGIVYFLVIFAANVVTVTLFLVRFVYFRVGLSLTTLLTTFKPVITCKYRTLHCK